MNEYPLTHTFLMRCLEDALNLIFNSPLFYLVQFFIVFMVLAILRYCFRMMR